MKHKEYVYYCVECDLIFVKKFNDAHLSYRLRTVEFLGEL